MPTINGTSGDDVLFGTPGDDEINGYDGNDALFGLDGHDALNGGEGNDFLSAGEGNDALDGGDGTDLAVYTDAAGSVHVDMVAGIVDEYDAAGAYVSSDTLAGIEEAAGSNFDDTLIGDDGANQLDGFDGNDVLDGGAGDDNLDGNAGDDTVHGGDGDDFVLGGEGDDLLIGGAGFDAFGGGDGTDTVSYADAPGPVDVDLSTGFATEYDAAGSPINHDTLVEVENVTGSAFDDAVQGHDEGNVLRGLAGNDLLVGYGGDDALEGGDGDDLLRGDGFNNYTGPSGNDTVSGGAGDDIMWTSAGIDSYDGGDGFDRVSLFSFAATQAAVASLITQTISNDGFGNAETMTSIEALGAGTAFEDHFTGDEDGNFLAGDRGDTLIGNGGHDTFQLSGAPALLDGGDGLDHITRFFGDVFGSIVPDSDDDELAELVFATRGVHVDLSLGMIVDDGLGNSGSVLGIESVGGSGLDDILIGDDGVNGLNGFEGDDVLEGRGGNDVFQGGDGDDVMIGGLGGDILQGGDGSDTASYADASGGIEVDLFDGMSGGSNGPDGSDTLISIENVTGSEFDDDIHGNDVANVLRGLGGDDYIFGEGGDDTIDGGDGADTTDYSGAGAGVTVNLISGTASGDGNDTLISIEHLVGSSFDDHLIGDGGNNSLIGLGGNDTLESVGGHDALRGRAGDDTLEGGDDDDFLDGGQGDDLIDGGDGFDRAAFFSTATAGVHVDLNVQGVAQDTGQGMDTLIGIEHLSGTLFDDVLIGNGGDNWINSGTAADSDTVIGGGGSDLISLGGGTHSVEGGVGVDALSFFNPFDIDAAGVTVSLAIQGAAQDTEQGMMTLGGFESLSGSVHGDSLTGDTGANVLAGDEGSDALAGGEGNDVMLGDGRIYVDFHGTGGSGPITTWRELADVFASGAGDDLLDGGKGDDLLLGGGGDDVLTGGKGNDSFEFGSLSGHDVITDFDKKEVIAIVGVAGVDDFFDLMIVQTGKDTVVSWDGGAASVLLDNFKAKHLSAANFDFGGETAALAAQGGHSAGAGPADLSGQSEFV